MSETKKRSQVLHSQAREIVYKVWEYMEKEREAEEINVNAVQKRAADATGISVRTLSRIISECKHSNHCFKTPGKYRYREKPVTGLSNFEKGIVKRCIHNFHITEKQMPNTRKLITKLRKDINYKGSTSSTCKIIRELGFQWRKTHNKLRLLIEKPTIRLKRIEFLRDMKRYREEGREIVYVGRTSVSLKHYHNSDVTKKVNIFILNAGSENGFLPNARALLKSYALEMTFQNYEKWLKNKVLPKLKPNSVIVLDNSLYYNKRLMNTIPTLNSKRADIISWLNKEKIPYTDDMLKPELYKLILQKEGTDAKNYVIDQIFTKYNHVVLHLPPSHPDLNAIEIAGTEIKKYIGRIKVKDTASALLLLKEKLDAMGDEWIALCKKIEYIENQYRSSDHVIDAMTEEYSIYNADSSESESDFEVLSEDSSGSDYDPTSNENDLLMEISEIKTSNSDDEDNKDNKGESAYWDWDT